jgi:hypothetical protein
VGDNMCMMMTWPNSSVASEARGLFVPREVGIKLL